MKKILGLDLGTTSIGWALVNEAEDQNEKSSIVKLGSRVVHYGDNLVKLDKSGKVSASLEPEKDFISGKGLSPNADRTKSRGMRRSLQRYKLRRDKLIEVLKENKIITDDALLSEQGNYSTFKTYENRSNAATGKIDLVDFAKILLMINKKRGYKSSRKAKGQDEGQLIDGIEVAKQLYESGLTPGQFAFQLLQVGKKYIPDFYRSDLQSEFDKIWDFQKQFYAELLTDANREKINKLSKTLTRDFFQRTLKIDLAEIKGKDDKKLKPYEWRSLSISKQMSINELAFVFTEINSQISNSSGYLGAISDRSKELIFNNLTVGQYLHNQIKQSPHARLKRQVFYRQDYLDEFNVIWEEQVKHYKALTSELKTEIRDIIIFYQRKLKSQKGQINFCEFESKRIEIEIDGKKKIKTVGARVCPKSSPLFQEFKIWQILNNIEVTRKKTREKRTLELEEKQKLFEELSIKNKMSKAEALRLLFDKPSELDLNYKDIEGNRTNAALFEAYKKIAEASGHEIDFETLDAANIISTIKSIFETLGINTSILSFDSSLEGDEFERQPLFLLWHLLYSYEDDNSKTGNEKLLALLKAKYNFTKEYALIIDNVTFQDDYGSLSSKAIRKILPYLMEGNTYDAACTYAGYNHSKSLTKKEKETKPLEDKLEILSKNSLRNPIVEKILNQMVNVVNAVIHEYKKPDEIRIELARELKKSADERKELAESNIKSKDDHEKYRKTLKEEFGLSYVNRKDIIKYKLYLELQGNGYKTLYSNTYISPEQLFSKEIDIDHIIPQAKLFDDSFSNKTLELKSHNIEKADRTAYEYVKDKYGDEGLEQYKQRVENLYKPAKKRENEGNESKSKDTRISKTKYTKFLMLGTEIPSGFIDRDIRDTQYIAKKAKAILEDVFREVTTTTGSITDRLREDWQLVDVMQELNWEKYKVLGLTYYETNRDGQQLPRIKDWTKRNDHRHHAMDALTVAFTKRSYVHYLNNLNARSDKSSSIYGIEQKELYRDERNKLRFKPPIPLDDFRAEAKKHLEATLISFKAKNKVATKNKNKIKTSKGGNTKIELTPRGQLHQETIYGSIKQYVTKEEKVGISFDLETINKVSKQIYKDALLKRLEESGNDPKKAFTGKNSLDKKPIYLDALQTQRVPEKVKLAWQEIAYTTRKEISPDLFKDSKKNDNFTNRLESIYDKAVRDALKNRYNKTKKEVEVFNQAVSKEKDKKKILETAFSNLDENPIWLNKAKGISIKRVTLTGIIKADSLHYKKDKDGKTILDNHGNGIDVDFVNTGNNHHVAVYRDEKGVLQEQIVSFYEAVERVNQGSPIINKSYKQEEGWQFLFTLKQNEYFVFPNEKTGFNPEETDLLNPENYLLISPNLYRVQKIATRNYFFRHHLETTVKEYKELKDIAYKPQLGLNAINGILKVRINHLGKIVHVGED
ncbi:MAG: type II CRISPR RNA-guided endonuclease Cas9 [Bacteroidota bacterium]